MKGAMICAMIKWIFTSSDARGTTEKVKNGENQV